MRDSDPPLIRLIARSLSVVRRIPFPTHCIPDGMHPSQRKFRASVPNILWQSLST